jgi:hypothetical protein
MLAALVPRQHLRAGGHALRVLAVDGEGPREMMQLEVVAD